MRRAGNSSLAPPGESAVYGKSAPGTLLPNGAAASPYSRRVLLAARLPERKGVVRLLDEMGCPFDVADTLQDVHWSLQKPGAAATYGLVLLVGSLDQLDPYRVEEEAEFWAGRGFPMLLVREERVVPSSPSRPLFFLQKPYALEDLAAAVQQRYRG